MHTIEILNQLIENNQVLAYLLIFLVTIIEGEILSISVGVLVFLGVLNFWIAILCIILGGLYKTVLGYTLGGYLHKKFNSNRFFVYIDKQVHHFLPHFEKKPFWSIFISKFIMINHFVIVFCGYKKINFQKYLKAEIFSTLFWAPGLILLGYFFGYTAVRLSNEIWQFSLIVLVLIIAFIIFYKFISWLYQIFEEIYDSNR